MAPGLMTLPGGAGLGGALRRCLQERCSFPGSYWTAASCSSGLSVTWLQGGPGRRPRGPEPQISWSVPHVPWCRELQGRGGGSSEKALVGLDWVEEKAVEEAALEWEPGVSPVGSGSGRRARAVLFRLLPIVAVVEIKSDGSWKVLRTLVSQVRCQYLPTGLLGESGTLS